MADTLEELLEQNRIIETINQLFIGTDNRDWTLVRRCLASTVHFDMSSVGAGEATDTSADDIIAMWDTGLKPLQAVHHQSGNFLVQVQGATAAAFCYGTATHYLPNSTNQNTRTFVGSYDFTLRKESDAWRISAFRFNLKYIDGNRNLEQS